MEEESIVPELEEKRERTPVRLRFQKLRRHWLTVSFLLGFVIDNLTLNRVDEMLDNIILATQVVLSTISILIMYAAAAGKFSPGLNDFGAKYAPLVMQYAFGGLLSGMLIFYGRSGDWMASWPFLVIILAAIFGNELIKDRSQRLLYNLAILFIGVLSYIVLVIPVATGYSGPWVFIGSGFIAVGFIYAIVQILHLIVPRFMQLQMKGIIFTVGIIYLTFNAFYFTNIIPPIPLSLKELGIYHSVVRFPDEGVYQVKRIESPWWQVWSDSDRVFYPSVSSGVFCFASVFSPTKLDAVIYHRWQYKDANGDWVNHGDRISYPIDGGIDTGFRGYTQVSAFSPGIWRCRVENERGQILGHVKFTVANYGVTPPGPLIKENK